MKADRLNALLAEGRELADDAAVRLEQEYHDEIVKAGGRAARALVRSQTMTAAADWEPPPWAEILAAAMLGVTFLGIRRRRMEIAYEAARPLITDLRLGPIAQHTDPVVALLPERTESLSSMLGPEIRSALQQSREEGWSVRQTARHLRGEIDDLARWQANLLARTDALTLENGASHAAVAAANEEFRKAGEPEFKAKRWLTAHDERVRPSHAEADGQTVPFNEPFLVGGSMLQYPCDPNGAPNEVWNCRCVALYEETPLPSVTAAAAAQAMTELADGSDEFLREFTEHVTRAIEDPARADATERFIIRSDPETTAKYRDWVSWFYALPLEERRVRIRPYLIPPHPALPSPETSREDTVSTQETTVEVPITTQFGLAAFAGNGVNPIAFQSCEPIKDGDDIVGFSFGESNFAFPSTFDFTWPVYTPTPELDVVPDLTASVSITIDEDAEAAAAEADPIAWEGVLSVEGLETGDGRYMFPDCFSWRELPLTLMALTETSEGGHLGAEVAGRIDEIWKVDAPDLGADAKRIMGRGVFAGNAYGQEIAQLVKDQILRGVSVDPGAVEVVLVDQDLNEVPDDEIDMEKLFAGEYMYGFKSYVIGAATLCPVPGFKEASIAVLSVEGRTLVASTFGIEVKDPPSLTAAAAPLAPPRSCFEVPEPNELTPMTITDQGFVFGHAATWECHESFRDRCVMAPRSRTGLAYFHTGEMLTAEGDLIAVGRWTVGGGHASIGESRVGANAHYDNASTVGAYLRAVEGRHGLWTCGVLKSNVTDEQLRDMRANPPSGDWRDGELILVHSVPVPGLPIFRNEARVLVASDGQEQVVALITAPVLDEDCGCGGMGEAEYEIRIEALSQLAELD